MSIIVLYNLNPAGNGYLNARGWHGLGGAQVISMAAMLLGVPNLPVNQVIVIPGLLQQSNFARQQNLAHVQAGVNVAHGNINVRYVAGRSNATVDRQGLIT
ncbi:MAG: hypothetical protein O2912_03230 [Proteobacteria bacterium]|nr:hypothetical protein [Pseudomonadota bacterium]